MCEYSWERVFSNLLHQCQRQGVVGLVNFITVVRTDHFAEIETHRVNNMANGSYKCTGEQYLSWVDKGTTIAVTPHYPILLHNHLNGDDGTDGGTANTQCQLVGPFDPLPDSQSVVALLVREVGCPFRTRPRASIHAHSHHSNYLRCKLTCVCMMCGGGRVESG